MQLFGKPKTAQTDAKVDTLFSTTTAVKEPVVGAIVQKNTGTATASDKKVKEDSAASATVKNKITDGWIATSTKTSTAPGKIEGKTYENSDSKADFVAKDGTVTPLTR